MTVANLITLFRIAVLPVLIYLIYQETVTASLWAISLLILAFLSDFLDGYLARKRQEITRVGSFLDPFADKLLVVVILFVYLIRGEFWWSVFLIFIIRDLIVGIIKWYASQDDVEINRWISGKFVNYAHFLIIFVLLLRDLMIYDGLFSFSMLMLIDRLVFWITILAVIVVLATLFQYVILYSKGLKQRIKSGKKIEGKKVVILANKKARGYKDRYRRRLLKVFTKRRKARIVYLPRTGNMYHGIMKEVKKADQIIIAGGDGSFESALNYAPFQKKSLGFFPLGAGNAFYSYFYKGNRFEYLRSRFSFHETELDILELEWDKGKVNTTFIALGIDADVIRLGKAERTQYGFVDYVRASAKAWMKVKSDYDFHCTIDGKKHHLDNCPNFTIAKIPYYGFSVRSLVGKVSPSDGKVYGLAVVNQHSTITNKVVRLWALVLAALHMNKAPLLPLKGKKFVVESDIPFPLQAGGEFLGFSQKITVKVLRKQKVLVI